MASVPVNCAPCGQVTLVSERSHMLAAFVCESCQSADREPQGEAVRLFEPAPTQITGQLSF